MRRTFYRLSCDYIHVANDIRRVPGGGGFRPPFWLKSLHPPKAGRAGLFPPRDLLRLQAFD